MQAMRIAHLLSTYYIAMCGHVVLLWMFASAHTFQICKYIGWHKHASWALRTNLFWNTVPNIIYTSCAVIAGD